MRIAQCIGHVQLPPPNGHAFPRRREKEDEDDHDGDGHDADKDVWALRYEDDFGIEEAEFDYVVLAAPGLEGIVNPRRDPRSTVYWHNFCDEMCAALVEQMWYHHMVTLYPRSQGYVY